ncbi:MAG: HAD family phosphatase [Lachnospiraceae bacterium]|nr:HAD family phosphatase [Lachnospiraceae bacterium]
MMNTVIFDIGMVLVDFCWREYLTSLGFPEDVISNIGEKIVNSDIWEDMDKGIVEDEELLERMVARAPENSKEVTRLFQTIGKVVKMYDYTPVWIRCLKEKGCKVYFLSNFPKRVYEQARDGEMAFTNECDGGLLSYKYRMVKPEPEFYQLLIDTYGINPKEAVFVDDRPVNLEGAKKFGIKTILFQSQKQVEEELCEMLGQKGVFVY